MRKAAIVILFLLLLAFVAAESRTDYVVNNRSITDLSIKELYALEDSVVISLEEAFKSQASRSEDGTIIGPYVINPRTKKFHYPQCYSAIQIGPDRVFMTASAKELVDQKYKPCGQCNPYIGE